MVSTRSVLAIALLVLLAGCGGVLGGDGGDGGDGTISPSPTPGQPTPTPTTEGPESVVDSYPAGVTDDGRLTNVSALVAGHHEALADDTYRAELRLEQVQSDGNATSERVSDQTVRVGDGAYRTDITTERSASPTFEATSWSNGSVAVRRVTVGDDPRYQRLDARRFVAQLSGRETLQGFVALGNYSVERVSGTGGETFVTLTADEYAGGAGSAEIEAFDSTLVVDGEGRIRELDVHVETLQNGTSVTVDFHYELTRLGDVTVDRPDWIETALAESS